MDQGRRSGDRPHTVEQRRHARRPSSWPRTSSPLLAHAEQSGEGRMGRMGRRRPATGTISGISRWAVPASASALARPTLARSAADLGGRRGRARRGARGARRRAAGGDDAGAVGARVARRARSFRPLPLMPPGPQPVARACRADRSRCDAARAHRGARRPTLVARAAVRSEDGVQRAHPGPRRVASRRRGRPHRRRPQRRRAPAEGCTRRRGGFDGPGCGSRS